MNEREEKQKNNREALKKAIEALQKILAEDLVVNHLEMMLDRDAIEIEPDLVRKVRRFRASKTLHFWMSGKATNRESKDIYMCSAAIEAETGSTWSPLYCPCCEEDGLAAIENLDGSYKVICTGCGCSGPHADSIKKAASKWHDMARPGMA